VPSSFYLPSLAVGLFEPERFYKKTLQKFNGFSRISRYRARIDGNERTFSRSALAHQEQTEQHTGTECPYVIGLEAEAEQGFFRGLFRGRRWTVCALPGPGTSSERR
jgi:hypothetical protein